MTASINASTTAGVVVTSDTSGSLAIQSNGTAVATVASTGTTLAGTTALTTLTVSGTTTLTGATSITSYSPTASLITRGTALTTTSGTTAGFTGIPSWVKRISVIFNGVGTSGSSLGLIQIGSGSYTTSGYSSMGASNATTTSSTQGFLLSYDWASTYRRYGIATLDLITGNTWVLSWQGGDNNSGGGGTRLYTGAGSLALSGALDRIQVTTVNGTDTFTAGTVNIQYE